MSSRLQREIEEILHRYDKATPRRKRLHRRIRVFGHSLSMIPSRLRLPHISLAQLMLLGVVLLLIAFVFPATITYTAWPGIAIFVIAFILSFRRTPYRQEMRWRRRNLDLRGPSFTTRLKRWWLQRRSRR